MCLKNIPGELLGQNRIAAEYKIDLKNKTEQETGTMGAAAGRLNPLISELHAHSPLTQGRKSGVQGKQTMAPVCSQSTGRGQPSPCC